MKLHVLFFCLLLAGVASYGQTDKKTIKTIDRLTRSYRKLSSEIARHTKKTVAELKALENAGGLHDLSAIAQYDTYLMLITDQKKGYDRQREQAKGYVSTLDSIGAMARFLSLPSPELHLQTSDHLQQLEELSTSADWLQQQMQQASSLQQFIKERQTLWRSQLINVQKLNIWQSYHQKGVYYQQQFNEYKSLLENPDKRVEKVMQLARRLPAFDNFMKKYGMLARLYPQPENYGSALALQGLQSRKELSAIAQQKMGKTTTGETGLTEALPMQSLQAGQTLLSAGRDKINQRLSPNSDFIQPEFEPNSQKGKHLWRRLEYGVNLQNQPKSLVLPIYTELAGSIGYKAKDGLRFGLGASYRWGWGQSIQKIHISHLGVGLRSFVDVKLKNQFWISGGAEMNYLEPFKDLQALHHNVDVWQKSALVGVSKRYKAGKKTGTAQLLYDVLATYQIPRAEPIKFRIGYIL